jgi:hypothetical protein
MKTQNSAQQIINRNVQWLLESNYELFWMEFIDNLSNIRFFQYRCERGFKIGFKHGKCAAQYTNDEVQRMREKNDARLYKAGKLNLMGFVRDIDNIESQQHPNKNGILVNAVWENGQFGHFILVGGNYLNDQINGRLMFRQIHKAYQNSDLFCGCIDLGFNIKKDPISLSARPVLDGFGQYLLRKWGKHVHQLSDDYTKQALLDTDRRLREQHYPDILNIDALQILNTLKTTEQQLWSEATISAYLTPEDYKKLQRSMEIFFKWLDTKIEESQNCTVHNSDHLSQLHTSEQLNSDESQQETVDGSDHLSLPHTSEQYAGGEAQEKKYSFDARKIADIYDFCVSTNVLQKNSVSNVDFINAVNTANFKTIYQHAIQQQSISRLKYIICTLSKFITGNNWYRNAARSIGTEPTKCSGINVPYQWKQQADAIR